MSESEPKDSKLEVEATQTTLEGRSKQEKESKDGTNRLDSNSTSASDTDNVPAITLENTGDELDVDADADADADSEAETLIQSPAKKRNSVVDGSTIVHQLKIAGSLSSETGSIVLTNTSDKENATRKRKRSNEEGPVRSPDRVSSRRSSPLSSPIAHIPSGAESGDSDVSDTDASPNRDDRQPSVDRISSPRKRRRPPSEITASTSSHKRSKRNSVETMERRETRSATYPRPSDDDNSPSPEITMRREHRRGASTQSTPHEFERRKRGRPPNIHTRRNRSADRVDHSSDESEPRTSRSRPHLHKFASNDHDTMSPVKDQLKTGPRKWKDKNGRTYLARACNNNDLEAAKARLAERPEDLNMEDNAGNTPLQIAALEGFDEIVDFLLSKGAEVNARNVDKDTPLLDAVENGHVEVVRLLLKYGANPRLANAKGDEPYEMVHPDDENYAEIRELLAGAKEKDTKKIAGIDASDFQTRDGAVSRATSAASPRDSPPIGPRSPPAFGSRRRTGRSESTRNDLLWQANTQENLAKLASKGDSQGVASILSILEKAETEAVIAAAKAGHEEVLQLLIAMGKPNPDPDPVRGSKMVPGYNTPILAAIGRGHPDVVKLLAFQAGFNPTRRYRNRTYYELAEERGGDRWEEEFKVLKQAYERWVAMKGEKSGSPRKVRDADRSKTRPARRSSSVNSGKRQMSSPSSTYKTLPTKTTDGPQRDLRKTSDPIAGKHRSIGSGDTMDNSIAIVSDVDQTVTAQTKGHRTRRSQSDLPPIPALDKEPIHKRRRLVTGKEHRSRQTISTSSDNEEDDDTDTVRVKQEEPNMALKRTRTSSTPNHIDDLDGPRATAKKRRTVLESSPDDQKSHALPTEQKTFAAPPVSEFNVLPPALPSKRNDAQVKSSVDVEMPDQNKSEVKPISANDEEAQVNADQNIKREPPTLAEVTQPSLSAIQAVTSEVEPSAPTGDVNQMDDISEDSYSPPPAVEPSPDPNTEEQERQRQEAEREATEQRIKAEAERETAEQRAKEEAHKAEQERQERIVREKAEEELRLKQEAEEKKRRQEEELAQRRKEEEEKQERQRQEMESRRRLEQLEQERRRLEALPIVLARTAQMIDFNESEVRSPQWLSKFLPLYTVKTQQLDPNCESNETSDEWIPNFQVAGLLTTKDLNLLSYTSFDKRPVTDHQRQCLWRVARLKLSYDANSLRTVAISKATEVERVAEEKFMSMSELFWVKLSDFLDQTSRFPHLADLNLSRQAISLKSYEEILGTRMKTSNLIERHVGLGLPNGVVSYANGENGII